MGKLRDQLRARLAKQVKDAGSVACSARERPRTPRCAAPGALSRLPPDGGVEVLDLLEGLGVDAGGEVLPAVVGDQEDDVAGVELTGDAGGDAGDRAAGEDALLLEELLRPDDRVAVGDHDFAVEKGDVDDRRDEAVIEGAEALDELSLFRLRGGDPRSWVGLPLRAPL